MSKRKSRTIQQAMIGVALAFMAGYTGWALRDIRAEAPHVDPASVEVGYAGQSALGFLDHAGSRCTDLRFAGTVVVTRWNNRRPTFWLLSGPALFDLSRAGYCTIRNIDIRMDEDPKAAVLISTAGPIDTSMLRSVYFVKRRTEGGK